MKNSRLVYSTENGRICPQCRKPLTDCECKKSKAAAGRPAETDGVIRIRKESKGRKGKTVSVIWGFDLDAAKLGLLAKQMKKRCGTGGSVKAGRVIMQGDHREQLKAFLEEQGYKVKLAGG